MSHVPVGAVLLRVVAQEAQQVFASWPAPAQATIHKYRNGPRATILSDSQHNTALRVVFPQVCPDHVLA